MREQLAAKPQSGSHPCGLAAEIPPYAEGVQDPQEPSGIENGHCSMPMTLVQRLPGLQKAPGVRNGLSYLMDGARNLVAVVGDFNVHHKIPLDYFAEIAYTDSEETHVSVLSRQSSARSGGGLPHFLYRHAKRTDPLCSANLSALNDLLLVALASNTSISFCLSIPYCPTNGVQFRSPGALFIPEGLEKTIVRKFSHPACGSTSAQ